MRRISLRFKKEVNTILTKVSLPPIGNRLLVVRLDAIGDYILFRNSLQEIKKSKRFNEHKITLLGNSLWKDLAERLDSGTVDEFIWIDPGQLIHQPEFSVYHLKLIIKLKLKRFSVIIHPVHSRILKIDKFIAAIKTPVSIGSRGDETNYQLNEKATGDSLYTELIEVPDHANFEFYRNAHFVSKLTEIAPDALKLQINLNIKPKKTNSIIISPGAGHLSRRWPVEKFAEVILKLNSAYPSAFFYICGSGSDKDLGDAILKQTMQENIQNICGQLTLIQYAELVNQARLVISNESSSIHLAAALDTPAICISNGNMFGRFNPYPANMGKNIQTIYSSDSFLKPNLFEINVERTRIRSTDDISNALTAKVVEAAHEILQNTTNSSTI